MLFSPQIYLGVIFYLARRFTRRGRHDNTILQFLNRLSINLTFLSDNPHKFTSLRFAYMPFVIYIFQGFCANTAKTPRRNRLYTLFRGVFLPKYTKRLMFL